MPGCTATWWHGVQNSLARERLEVDAGDVHVLAGARFVGRRFDFELLLAVDRFGDAVAADAAEHRREDVARLDPPLAVRFAVDVLHAVAGDARDALAGHFGQVPQRLGSRCAQGRGHRRVAAHAEVADRALRQVVELLLELVEHRRDGRVGVGRDAPLVVDVLVAGGTFAGRGVGVLGEQLEVRVDALLWLRRRWPLACCWDGGGGGSSPVDLQCGRGRRIAGLRRGGRQLGRRVERLL